MLRFEYPNHLYFFLVLILLILVHYYTVYRRKHKLNKFGEKALVKDLLIDVSTWKPEVKFWLCMLALSMFIIAYARPQFGTKIDKRERMGIEAIIAIDVSNSMYAEDVKPNRLEKAKMMMSNMVDGMKDDKVGLIVFAGQAFTRGRSHQGGSRAQNPLPFPWPHGAHTPRPRPRPPEPRPRVRHPHDPRRGEDRLTQRTLCRLFPS